MTDNKLRLEIKADLELIAIEAPTERVVELAVQAPAGEQHQDRAKLNLALVIDRSGSMSGQKLEYVKKAAIYVLDLLQDEDKVALVAYDDEIKTISESVYLKPKTRSKLRTKIQALESGNTTNLSGGWLQGCNYVAAAQQDGYLNRALLLSDGLANRGITDLEELGVHANELQRRGVSTSTFGVGAGFNEHLMEHMANQGGGNFYFIPHPEKIPDIFMQELECMAAVTARDVVLNLDIPEGVEAEALGDWKSEPQNGKLTIFLGDMGASQQREVYLKLLFPPQSDQEKITLRAKVFGKGESDELLENKAKITLQYVDRDTVKSTPRDADFMRRFGIVYVADVVNKAHILERRGEHEKASKLIKRILDEFGEYIDPDELVYYDRVANRMMIGDRPEMARKSSHYKSYMHKQRRIRK